MSWAAIPIATALRRAFSKGYRPTDLRADVLAGRLPAPALPWSGGLSLAQVRELLPAALAIALAPSGRCSRPPSPTA